MVTSPHRPYLPVAGGKDPAPEEAGGKACWTVKTIATTVYHKPAGSILHEFNHFPHIFHLLGFFSSLRDMPLALQVTNSVSGGYPCFGNHAFQFQAFFFYELFLFYSHLLLSYGCNSLSDYPEETNFSFLRFWFGIFLHFLGFFLHLIILGCPFLF